MHCRRPVRAVAWAVALLITIGAAQAFDATKYPNLKGQWTRVGGSGEPTFDPGKPPGRGQQAPLTPEYQAIFEANLREQAAGVPPTWPGRTCLPPGMPATMTAYQPMEIVVLPRMTLIRIDYIRETRRRIFTDGRAWPSEVEPAATSAVPAHSISAASRCTRTIKPSSRSGSSSTRPTRISCTTK